MEFGYRDVEELIKLEEKVISRGLEDQEKVRLDNIRARYKPFDIDQLIKFTKEIKRDYEKQYGEEVSRYKEKAEKADHDLKEIMKKFREISRIIFRDDTFRTGLV